MASHFEAITNEQAELLRDAKVFFVASADPSGAKGPHGVGSYGKASVQAIHESPYAGQLLDDERRGPTLNIRQVIVLDVESTMTSCGYGVPVMDFVRHRTKDDRGRRFK